MLVFSDTGRLRASGQLNQADALVLPPGKYNVLSRFAPNGFETTELWDDPALITFPLLVHPSKETILSNGPAKLSIQGETQPFAAWSGKSRTSKEGVDFYYDGLSLTVEFPPEWAVFSGKVFALQLNANALGDPIQLRFTIDELGIGNPACRDCASTRALWSIYVDSSIWQCRFVHARLWPGWQSGNVRLG